MLLGHVALHLVLHGTRHSVHHRIIAVVCLLHVLLLRLHHHGLLVGDHFEGVHIVGIVHQVHHQIHISFHDALRLEEVLHGKQVETQLLALG